MKLIQRWLHFKEYIVQDVVVVLLVEACVPRYIVWFHLSQSIYHSDVWVWPSSNDTTWCKDRSWNW